MSPEEVGAAEQAMTPQQEREALREKVEEIKKVTAQMDQRLNRLPFREDTRQMRELMTRMLSELHRMERNIESMLRLDEENEKISEGGIENG